MRCYLGLGSNLGGRWSHLHAGVASLAGLGDTSVSPVYETDPVGGPPGQGRYLNCVVALTTTLSPRELLAAAQAAERARERVREEPNGPRTLDVDVLLVEGFESSEHDLVVPHPRLAARAFVLAPLEDLNPSLVPANWRASLAGSEAGPEHVRRVGALIGAAATTTPRSGEEDR